MSAYYNEIDEYAAQWLRNLIAAGHIAPGDVDTRSIVDVSADDLKPYTQCHFFAGIGVWSHALRLSGWDDDREVWTGSCPCQPFSVAGAGKGQSDERNLWPEFYRLIAARKPAVVFGEQVEAAIRHGWLDLVQADLEGSGYEFGAAGIPAAGVGAPHIRQRLWFVAERGVTLGDACGAGLEGRQRVFECANKFSAGEGVLESGLADAEQHSDRCQAEPANHQRPEANRPTDQRSRCRSSSSQLADSLPAGRAERRAESGDGSTAGMRCCGEHGKHAEIARPTNGFWRDADWLFCRDGKWRPVESTTERMADGVADSLGFVRTGENSFGLSPLKQGAKNRVGRLKAYGNAIVPQVASEFIKAYMDCRP